MKTNISKYYSLGLLSAFVLTASTASAATIVFGAGGTSWADLGFSDNLDTGAGGVDAVIAQDGLTFTLNVVSTATSGGEIQLMASNRHIGPATGGNVWDSADGTFIFSISVTENTSTLSSIDLKSIDLAAWNNVAETVAFTAFDDTTATIAGNVPTAGVIDYDTIGITQLSLGNIATWDFEVDVTAGDLQGVESLSFEYTTVPEPGTYALLAGCAALGFVMLRRRR
jgi:hypothetical protein